MQLKGFQVKNNGTKNFLNNELINSENNMEEIFL